MNFSEQSRERYWHLSNATLLKEPGLRLFRSLLILSLLLTMALFASSRSASAHPPASLRMLSADQNAAKITPGRIERVECRANRDQSYAVYLPSKYSPERKWPILYAFDPAARGQVPVDRFKTAAEEYGWILVGSNNSQNGPNKWAVDAFEAMWQDTHERFSIDERRVYAAGFSGGARAAVGLAARCDGCIAGVIASGSGFHLQVGVSQKLPFLFFATIGSDDYNFPELKDLEGKLIKAGIANRLAVFSGGHEWLPVELAVEAVQWMEVEAMKSGRREKDPALIESLWQARLTSIQATDALARRLEAYRSYQSLVHSFSGLRDVATISEKVEQLRETRDVKGLISDEKNEIKKQLELENRLGGLLSQRRIPENRLAAVADFRAEINVLIRQARESQNTSQRRVAKRVLNSLLAGNYEQAQGALRAADYAAAAYSFEIATEIAPDNGRLLFDLACAQAQAGDKKRALQSLRKAVEKGFSDLDSILTNRALDNLRGDAVYISLVKGLKKEP